MQLFAYFLDTLNKMPDGDGSVLDHSLILYGGGIGNPNLHEHTDLPALVAGGGPGFKMGRHVKYANETPKTNLLLSMLDTVGVKTDALGDSTGRLDYLTDLA